MFSPERYGHFERFLQLPGLTNTTLTAIYNQDIMLSGTNAAAADLALATTGVTLVTHAGANDQAILSPQSKSGQTLANTMTLDSSKSPFYEAKFTTASAITACCIWAGLKLTTTQTGATDDDQVFVRYDSATSSGKWVLWVSRAGTDTTIVTDLTVAVSTDYLVQIYVDAARQLHVSINGTSINGLTLLAPITADVALIPVLGIAGNGTAAAKTIYVKHLAFSREW